MLCADIGSTFTKALLVDLEAGVVLATTDRPTTIASTRPEEARNEPSRSDVLDGLDQCVADLAEVDPRARDAEVLACSSAGGGLRILVVGNEELVTAEAGRRVALSAGGRVVGVVAVAGGSDGVAGAIRGQLTPQVSRLGRGRPRTSTTGAPDVVLLTGGTDGGNREALVAAARATVDAGWAGPVVVAGNVDAHPEVERVLAGLPYVLAENAVPRIGVLAPESARAAIREMFLAHVIGGKGLSSRPGFARLVRGATPDLVLAGVELLARGLDEERPGAGDVAVVDVGGATTDVYSVRTLDPELSDAGLAREVVAPTSATRTVEGDLGMRWTAVDTTDAARAMGSHVPDSLVAAAERRRADPGFVPSSDDEFGFDEALAALAAGTAIRRHAGRARVVVSPEGRVVERTGVDLREVDLLVGSGGVLRHGRPGVADRLLGGLVAHHHPDGWQLPERARVTVDAQYLLAAIGLLAVPHPDTAHRLARTLAK